MSVPISEMTVIALSRLTPGMVQRNWTAFSKSGLLLVRRLNATSGFYNCGNEKRFVDIDTTTGLISNFHSQTPFVNDKKPLTELPHN